MPKGYYGNRNWTPKQLADLDEMLSEGYGDVTIARRLGKTPNAVNLKRKRLGMTPRRNRLLSAHRVADIMGWGCAKKTVHLLHIGALKGQRGPRQGPYRIWNISEEFLVEFIADAAHWHKWDHNAITDPSLKAYAREIREGQRWYTTGQVARMFHIANSRAITRWIEGGYLSAVKWGNWCIPASALEGFVIPSERSKKGRSHRRFTTSEDAEIVMLREQGHGWTATGRAIGRHAAVVQDRWNRLRQRQGVEV